MIPCKILYLQGINHFSNYCELMWFVIKFIIFIQNFHMMKKNTFNLLILMTLFTGITFSQTTIEITNQYPFDREDEMVEVSASEFGGLKDTKLILTDENNQEIPYQLLYNGTETPQAIIFPATVKTGTKVVYTLTSGNPKAVVAKTSARFVPERKDDFTWENDLAAYRMYGPALANENPSNGIDLWLKKTTELVVDSFYRGELQYGKSYHEDHGQGLDCYKVGNTLGAGGIAPYVDGKLLIGKNFDSYKVLDNGPLRSAFTLTYNQVDINGKSYKKDVTISTDAGTVLNKAVVKLTGEKQPMQLAAGITLHDGKGSLQRASGLIVYGENAVTYKTKTSVGKNFVGVVLPDKEDEYKIQNLHALLISNYVPGDEFTYYFGGGWSQWQFPTQKEWLAAVQQFSKQVKYPLSIKVVQAP